MHSIQTLAEAKKALEQEQSTPAVPEKKLAVVEDPKPAETTTKTADAVEETPPEATEPWLQDDADDKSEAGNGKTVPLASHISLRTKLRATVTEVKGENEQLKARLAELEKASRLRKESISAILRNGAALYLDTTPGAGSPPKPTEDPS